MLTFNAHKAIPLLVLPLGASFLLLAAALKWRKRALIVVPTIALALFSTPFTSNQLMRSLEDRYPYVSLTNCPQADAVFVFGGMLDQRDRDDGSIAWNEAAERFDRAVRIIQAHRARTLVFSGGALRTANSDEGSLMRREAMARGVPERQIIVTAATTDTKSEAIAICALAARMSWKRVLLVTSAYHLPRAMHLSRNCPVERVPVPVAYRTPDPSSSWAQLRIEYYLPQAQTLWNSELALREYIGILSYSVMPSAGASQH